MDSNFNQNFNNQINYNNTYDNCDSINSFHYFDLNKEEMFEDIEMERINSSAMYPYMFNRIFDTQQSIKKNSLDLSDCEDHIFVDKLNISEIKPLQNDYDKLNNYKESNTTNNNIRGFDPILEMDEQEIDNNNDESFIHENNSLFKDMKDQSSIDMNLSCNFQQEHPLSLTMNEESVEMLSKIKKNMMALKIQKNMNNTFISDNKLKKNLFQSHNNQNSTNITNTTNINNLSNNNNHRNNKCSNLHINNHSNLTFLANNLSNNFLYQNLNLTNNINNLSSSALNNNLNTLNEKTNMSNYQYHNHNCNLSIEYKNNSCSNISLTTTTNNNLYSNNNNTYSTSNIANNVNNNNNTTSNNNINSSINTKRGRKKILIDGVKTELLDKAFLREFKNYVKKTKSLKTLIEELSYEEKHFWNEFLNNSSPPFSFIIKSKKTEFKSYNKKLLSYIFSLSSAKHLYECFMRDKEKEVVVRLLKKRSKSVDKMTFLYYSYYGKNLHKIYSEDDLDMDLIDGMNDYVDCHTTSQGTISFGSLSRTSGANKNNSGYYYKDSSTANLNLSTQEVSGNTTGGGLNVKNSKSNSNFNNQYSNLTGSVNTKTTNVTNTTNHNSICSGSVPTTSNFNSLINLCKSNSSHKNFNNYNTGIYNNTNLSNSCCSRKKSFQKHTNSLYPQCNSSSIINNTPSYKSINQYHNTSNNNNHSNSNFNNSNIINNPYNYSSHNNSSHFLPKQETREYYNKESNVNINLNINTSSIYTNNTLNVNSNNNINNSSSGNIYPYIEHNSHYETSILNTSNNKASKSQHVTFCCTKSPIKKNTDRSSIISSHNKNNFIFIADNTIPDNAEEYANMENTFSNENTNMEILVNDVREEYDCNDEIDNDKEIENDNVNIDNIVLIDTMNADVLIENNEDTIIDDTNENEDIINNTFNWNSTKANNNTNYTGNNDDNDNNIGNADSNYNNDNNDNTALYRDKENKENTFDLSLFNNYNNLSCINLSADFYHNKSNHKANENNDNNDNNANYFSNSFYNNETDDVR